MCCHLEKYIAFPAIFFFPSQVRERVDMHTPACYVIVLA